MKKAVLIVLDSVGAGYLPDAAAYGDEGANTLRHVAESMDLKVPNMRHMGLGHLPGLNIPPDETAVGAWGRAAECSSGKDTTTGHWEIAGVTLPTPFPTFPNGFPDEVIRSFEEAIGTRVIGNKPASGTAILDELGEEHMRTGYPIVYTSADSVFQIACHEGICPLSRLYEMCRIARAQLQGKYGVGRVIARPFVGEGKGRFTRTPGRKDFSLEPIGPTILDVLKDNGFDTLAVGKIEDIFAMRGITSSVHSAGNPACIQSTLDYLHTDFNGLLFVNLVDTDMIYGHRRDPLGYGNALIAFDEKLPEILGLLNDGDLIILTADHGCDPTFRGTDHTREYIPILCLIKGMKQLRSLGERRTFADIAATISDYFGLSERFGADSFLSRLE
ncbi:MAG: phosphopentomutase [Clostridia bacterium]|nr:phosphopentomutase [Clostridia bacterium]